MEQLNDILFYTIDKSIKSYRQFSQKQLRAAGFTITVDQWLVLKSIEENNTISQQQIAEKVFKDVASITRIIELLVQKGYLARHFHATDRRRFELLLTDDGKNVLAQLQPYITANRARALEGLTNADVATLQELLTKIINNVA